MWVSYGGGFASCTPWARGAWTSVVGAHGLSSHGSPALEHRFSGCDAQAEVLCGMWDLPGSEIKPRSPALAGGVFPTGPPGKPKGPSYSPVLEKQFGLVDSST